MLIIALTAGIASFIVSVALPRFDMRDVQAEDVELLALIAPRDLVQSERYVIYAGLARIPHGARVNIRICDRDSCQLNRTQDFGDKDTWWGWLGAPQLAKGHYKGDLFFQVRSWAGNWRTVASHSWPVTVHD